MDQTTDKHDQAAKSVEGPREEPKGLLYYIPSTFVPC